MIPTGKDAVQVNSRPGCVDQYFPHVYLEPGARELLAYLG